jgi:hypothetical protein
LVLGDGKESYQEVEEVVDSTAVPTQETPTNEQ